MATKNLTQRMMSGSIYVALILLSVLAGKPAFVFLFSMIVFIAVTEFYALFSYRQFDVKKYILLFVSIGAFIFLSFIQLTEYKLVFKLACGFYLFLFLLFSFKFNRKKLCFYLFPLIYIALALSFLSRFFDWNENGKHLLISFFTIVWVYDSFAFLVGKKLGKHPLAGRISPHKTVEGFVGGLIFGWIAAFVFYSVWGILSVVEWVGFASVIMIFGTIGDLFESYLKRINRQKDSGTFFIGHGGLLDRIDSILLAAPFACFYLLQIFR